MMMTTEMKDNNDPDKKMDDNSIDNKWNGKNYPNDIANNKDNVSALRTYQTHIFCPTG